MTNIKGFLWKFLKTKWNTELNETERQKIMIR